MTKLYKALSIVLFLSCLFIIPAQAENIDLNESMKKYFKAIEKEALKDGVILSYKVIKSKNELLIEIHSKHDPENRFWITYELSDTFETLITVRRHKQSIWYESPVYSYGELSKAISSEIKTEEGLLKILDMSFESMFDGIAQEVIRFEKKQTSESPFTSELFAMLAKTRNRYIAIQTGFYLLLATATLDAMTTSLDSNSAIMILMLLNFEVIVQLAKSYYKDIKSFGDILELTHQAQTWRKNSTITLSNSCASHFKNSL